MKHKTSLAFIATLLCLSLNSHAYRGDTSETNQPKFLSSKHAAMTDVNVCAAPVRDQSSESTALDSALSALQNHLNGTATLDDNQLSGASAIIEASAEEMAASEASILQSFDVIELYDSVHGPLFVNSETSRGLPRPSTGLVDAIHYAIAALQQSVLDNAYTDDNLLRYKASLENRGFATSDYFPGTVPSTADTLTHTTVINASNRETIQRPFLNMTDDARRPTGTYAAPGSIVSVTVPDNMIGSDFKVRVGAHTWNLEGRTSITRLDRVSLSYPINCATTLVSNPLGGGIYIEVPYGADLGTVNVQIENAIRSPFYAARSFTEHTTAQQWENEKAYSAPWADLEGDHFMIQVPTPWLDVIDDPEQLMADWDAAIEGVQNLFGMTETDKTLLYAQIDTISRNRVAGPGYPFSNYPYDARYPGAANDHQALLQGPLFVRPNTLHEMGHHVRFTKFTGEIESAVHLLSVYVQNKVFDIDLYTAFNTSIIGGPEFDYDETFINWASRPNFQAGLPMHFRRPFSETDYQHRGHGKYVAIVKLFGWEPLERFWASVQEDYLNGINYTINTDPTDSRILRMSRAANVDLTPLIHVWGIHPENPDELAAAIQAENLPASAAIYDELQHLKTVIPTTNEAFMEHALTRYRILRDLGPESFEGMYYNLAQTYSQDDANLSIQALQDIIDLYFPSGRPIGDEPTPTGISLPATIEAESFTEQNGIQIGQSLTSTGNNYVGWINDNDSISYNVISPESGLYTLTARVSGDVSGGTITFSSSGNVVGRLKVSPTGGWQRWKEISTTLMLNSGSQILQLDFAGDDGNFLLNLDQFSIELAE